MSKPKQLVRIEWSPEFAYAIGLLVTDGNLSKSGRHIEFTSKDCELVEHLRDALRIHHRISKKARGGEAEKKYYRIQIGDVVFYRFLQSIGLSQRKSHTLSAIVIPDEYFFDFLRGHFDGDGSFYSYKDPRWKNSFMYYLTFVSASPLHLIWLRKTIRRLAKIEGHYSNSIHARVFQLRFAKRDSNLLINKMYHSPHVPRLTRKHLKIQKTLSILHAFQMRGW